MTDLEKVEPVVATPEAQPPPQPKVTMVLIVKDESGKWKYSFQGKIRIREINQMRRSIGVEYMRSRRRRRLDRLTSAIKKKGEGK